MKKYNRKIDVIIPAYNVPDNIIFRCLASIACQDIVKEIEVTIVDDASTQENYDNIAELFRKFLTIYVICLVILMSVFLIYVADSLIKYEKKYKRN